MRGVFHALEGEEPADDSAREEGQEDGEGRDQEGPPPSQSFRQHGHGGDARDVQGVDKGVSEDLALVSLGDIKPILGRGWRLPGRSGGAAKPIIFL